MEKRFTLALVLSLLVIFAYQFWTASQRPPEDKTRVDKPVTPPDSASPELPTQDRPPTPAPLPPPVVINPDDVRHEVIENDLLRVRFTNLGAAIESAELLDYYPTAQKKDGERPPLYILNQSPDLLHALRLDELSNSGARLGERLWEMRRDGQTVIFETEVSRPSGNTTLDYGIRKEIAVPAGKSRHLTIRITMSLRGAGANIVVPSEFALLVSGGVFQEAGVAMIAGSRSGLWKVEDSLKIVNVQDAQKGGRPAGEAMLGFLRGETTSSGVVATLSGELRYAADLSTYFGAFLVLESFPDKVTANVNAVRDLSVRPDVAAQATALPDRTCTAIKFRVDLSEAEATQEALLYLGPLDEGIIQADLHDVSLPEAAALSAVYEEQLGAFSLIGKLVLWILDRMHRLTGNWGWAIVLLTFVVRIVLFPVNRRSQGAMLKHQEAMARIKPKLEALKKKHEKDPRKFAEAQMKLMRTERVPLVPLGGCLPILLQIPIFFGLLAALRASIDLRQASWLWVADLSQPDHLHTFATPKGNPLAAIFCCAPGGMPDQITGLHLLPILMTAAWVLNSYFMPRPATNDPQMEQQRKMMMFMPVLFGFMMYFYASGLSLYWLTSSIIGIFETRIIKKLWPVKHPDVAAAVSKP